MRGSWTKIWKNWVQVIVLLDQVIIGRDIRKPFLGGLFSIPPKTLFFITNSASLRSQFLWSFLVSSFVQSSLFQHHTPSKPFLPVYKRVPKPKHKCDRGMHPPGFLSLCSASGVVVINRCLEFWFLFSLHFNTWWFTFYLQVCFYAFKIFFCYILPRLPRCL